MTTERNLREELLNQNGIGVQKGADLRDKVLARQLGEHGRQWVGERFRFSEYIDALEQLFAEVAGTSNPVRAIA